MVQWFKKEDNDSGHRSLKEQMLGLERALHMAKGKSVLDLGCAEGLISKEFLKAGADSLTGIDITKTYIEEAIELCKDFPNAKFIRSNLNAYIKSIYKGKYDVVLALAIIQKAKNPNDFLKLAIDSCNLGGLIVIRYPIGQSEGIIKSKICDNKCDVIKTMADNGFISKGKLVGPRGEVVEYWINVTI
jgi:2-polyprenyl-3-methyl-5-hydroxy-6-metoxy-1,4-benzoquinol methylase